MDERQQATEILSESECWELLDHAAVGRLAVDIAGQPDIFPINFVVDKSGIVFRSAAGTKLAGAVLNRIVAFEIDGYEPADRTAWSVVVKGEGATDRADAGDVRGRGPPVVPLAGVGQAELRSHRADGGHRPALPHRRRRSPRQLDRLDRHRRRRRRLARRHAVRRRPVPPGRAQAPRQTETAQRLGTTTTGSAESCSSHVLTEPSNPAAISPRPRVPTTTRSACSWASASA